MKQKIKITDFNGKVTVSTVKIRNKEFYQACAQYHPTTVHRSKKDYTRKIKHKKDLRLSGEDFFVFPF